MSEESNNRLLAEFLSQSEAACREGRGEDLLKAFYKRQAESHADFVFLRMEQVISNPPTQDAGKLFEILDAMPHTCGLALLKAVASTCVHWNMPREHQIAAETITGEAYSARLQFHMDTTMKGGSA